MAKSNVTTLHDPLARLAADIKADLARCTESIAHWSEAAINLCLHLAEAKAQFPALIEFGKWCEANGFGESVMNAHDRAAAIKMGENIEAARPVLQITERRSLRLILKNECRFGSGAKTKKSGAPKKSRGDHRKLTDEQALSAAQAVLDDRKTMDDAGAMFGVSRKTVKAAVAKEQGRREVQPDSSTFARTTKEQFDRAVRVAVAEAREQFEDEVRAKVQKKYDEIFIPHAFEKAEYADAVLASRHGIMSRADFMKVLSCLHPDTATSPWKERCSEAFDLFKKMERLLVKQEPNGIKPSDLPRTMEELLARRKAMAR